MMAIISWDKDIQKRLTIEFFNWTMDPQELVLTTAQCQSKEHLTVVNLGARFAQETQQGQEQLNSCQTQFQSCQTDSASLIPKPRRWLKQW